MAGDGVREITAEEIFVLPRWAQLVFALRCATRVEYLVDYFGPAAARLWQIHPALRFAEACSIAGNIVDLNINQKMEILNSDDPGTSDAIRSAVEVYRAVCNVRDEGPLHDMAAFARAAADSSVKAAAHVSADAAAVTARACRRDIHLLQRLLSELGWTQSSRVDFRLLGPLWPEGKPDGWPEYASVATSIPTYLKLEFAIPAGLSDDDRGEFAKRVAAFYADLSAMHVALGGTGLRIVSDESCESLPVAAELPVGAGGGR